MLEVDRLRFLKNYDFGTGILESFSDLQFLIPHTGRINPDSRILILRNRSTSNSFLRLVKKIKYVKVARIPHLVPRGM